MQLKSVLIQALLIGSAVFSVAGDEVLPLDLYGDCLQSVIPNYWFSIRATFAIRVDKIRDYTDEDAYNSALELLEGGIYLPTTPNLPLFNKLIRITGDDFMNNFFHLFNLSFQAIGCDPYLHETASSESMESTQSTETESTETSITESVHKCSEVIITYVRPRVHISTI
ncbi:hypothetical protein LPJ66_005603 [Kickxella alabastrina]|uniref:Uncharacterized protein n=1 Tax=Kickxella alabastrina TaxID=61397 RepID=A0ACC1IGC7_9FUNG|nr:hypothetical protein LPJ66_005603 [Kickxella alabastrina]